MKKGFTLVETLVAVTVVLLAIVGPLTIFSQGLVSGSYARDQVTALYLAQEGMEMVRSVRDDNALHLRDWLNTLADRCLTTPASPKKCVVISPLRDGAAVSECVVECPALNFSVSERRFSYSEGGDWKPSIFTREVQIATVPGNASEVRVATTVRWKTGSLAERVFTLRENLLNWQ